MLCSETCPRGLTNCKPLSNIVETDENGTTLPDGSLVCVGLHSDVKPEGLEGDRFRHCFRSNAGDVAPGKGVDMVSDNDEYDLESMVSVITEALLIDRYIENVK